MSETRQSAFDPYWQWLQIPPDRRPANHYELLGVPVLEQDIERIRGCGMDRIATVRRYQVGRHGDVAIRLLGELSRAFDCLTTADRKADYDRQLRGGATHAEPPAAKRSTVADRPLPAAPSKRDSPKPPPPPPPFNGKIGPSESYAVNSSSPPIDDGGNPFVRAMRPVGAADGELPVVVAEYVPEAAAMPLFVPPLRRSGPLTSLFRLIEPLFSEYLWVTLAISAALCAVGSLPFLLRSSPRTVNTATAPANNEVARPPVDENSQPPFPGEAGSLPTETPLENSPPSLAPGGESPADQFPLGLNPGMQIEPAQPGALLGPGPSTPLGSPPGEPGLGIGMSGRSPSGGPFGPQASSPATAPAPGGGSFVPRDQLIGYSAGQVTGPADTQVHGDFSSAWASQTPDGEREWLLVEFSRPVLGRSLQVHQSCNPGAIARIDLYDEAFQLVPLWQNTAVRPEGPSLSQFVAPIHPPRMVQRVRIELDSPAVAGWNEIDAVELVDEAGASHWAAWAASSSSYAENAESVAGRSQLAAGVASLEEAFRASSSNRPAPGPSGLAAIGEVALELAWRRAKCQDKYGMLLMQFPSYPDANLGFQEAGFRDLRSYAGRNQIPSGYWVYVAPYWYVWRDGPQTSFNKSSSWSAFQATGAPNVNAMGDNGNAWASATTDDQDEWLLLEYAHPIKAKQIIVHESYNPGAVNRVTAFGLDGRELVTTPAPRSRRPSPGDDARPVQLTFNATSDAAIGRVKVYVASTRIAGYNEIDAVRVVDDQGAVHHAIAAEASSSYAGPYATIGGSTPGSTQPAATYTELDAKLLAMERQLVGQSQTAAGFLYKLLSSAPGGAATADLLDVRLRRLQGAALATGAARPPGP